MAEFGDEPDRIRQDLLQRLRWRIFGPLSDIRVKENDTLIPLSSYQGVTQPVANPPLSRLSVRIGGLEDKHALDEHEDEDRYQPPEPLVIANESGEPITLGDFVTRVHEYLNANKGEIMDRENELWPDDEGDFGDTDPDEDSSQKNDSFPTEDAYYFDQARTNEIDVDEFEVSIEVFIAGSFGVTLERYWEIRDTV